MLSDTWCFFLCCCIKEVKSKDNKEEKAKAACNCIRVVWREANFAKHGTKDRVEIGRQYNEEMFLCL